MQMILSGNGIKSEQVLDLRPGEDLQIGCGLKTGSIVRAAVIFASDSNINIKLDNGMVIRATVQGIVALAEGDEALFFVSQNDGRRIVLTPVDEVSIGWTGSDISEGAAAPTQNLTPMKWSPNIMAAIERCGCTPTDELAGKVAEIMKNYPEAQAETAVFIAEGELEPNSENIEIGNVLNRETFRTGQEIGRFLDIISVKMPKDIPNEAEPNRQNAVPARPEPGEGTKGASGVFRALSTGQGESKLPGIEGQGGSKFPDTEGERLLPGDVRWGKTAKETPGHYLQEQPGNAKAEQESVFTGRGRLGTSPKYPDNGPGGNQKFDPKAVKSLAEEIFVSADNKCTGEKLKKVVTGLPARTEALRGFAADAEDTGGGDAGHLIGRVASALKFMNSIPGFAYVQIPLLYRGVPGTADLYVLRRRRRRGGKEQGELCAVLVLDMKNLGHVEACLRICGRGMTIRLTADGEKQASFLSEHLGELRKPLYQAGYELTGISAVASWEKITPAGVAAVFGREERGASGKIDLRI